MTSSRLRAPATGRVTVTIRFPATHHSIGPLSPVHAPAGAPNRLRAHAVTSAMSRRNATTVIAASRPSRAVTFTSAVRVGRAHLLVAGRVAVHPVHHAAAIERG